MTFAEAVKTCFARFFVIFKGRSRRSEYWFTTLLYCIVVLAIIAVTVSGLFLIEKMGEEWVIVIAFCYLVGLFAAQIIAIPLFPATWRRLHDVGKPGWLFVIDYPLALALSFSLVLTETESTAYYIIGIIFSVFLILELFYRIYILVLLCLDGNPYTNKYGPDPKGRGLERQMALAEENAAAGDRENAAAEAASSHDFESSPVPPVEVPEKKAKKDKGYLTLSIVLAIIVVLLMGLLFAVFTVGSVHQAEIEEVSESNASLLAENEALQGEIAALEQDAALYDSLRQHLRISTSNPNFYPSEYVFVLNPGETEIFTLSYMYDGAATINAEQYGEAAEFAFMDEEFEYDLEVLLTAKSAGITEIYFTNTANDDAFSVIVLVMEE